MYIEALWIPSTERFPMKYNVRKPCEFAFVEVVLSGRREAFNEYIISWHWPRLGKRRQNVFKPPEQLIIQKIQLEIHACVVSRIPDMFLQK